MSRPNLPYMHQKTEQHSSSARSLPPLSEVLKSSVGEPATLPPLTITQAQTSAPVSPKGHGSIDLSLHQLSKASLQTPSMKTPIRLPSFDSLNLNTKQEGHSKLPFMQQSKSFSLPSVLSGSDMSQSSPRLPTPTSHIQEPRVSVPQDSPLVEKRSYAFISHSPSTYPTQEPSIDNAQLARRKRRRTTPKELAILHEEFEQGSTPNRARREEIASKVDMTEKAVQIWFQNRRQTLRRQSHAEREVHHLEPIYPHISQEPSIPNETPIRQQPIIFTTLGKPHVVRPALHQYQTAPLRLPPSSSPTPQEGQSPQQEQHYQASSPLVAPAVQISQFKNDLATPSRKSKVQAKSPTTGSTFTFKLTSSANAIPANEETIKNNQSSPTKLSMTPISSKQRQKPIMKVNPSPPRNFKGDLESNKENIPVDIRPKLNNDVMNKIVAPAQNNGELKDRKPLGELRTNSNPNKSHK